METLSITLQYNVTRIDVASILVDSILDTGGDYSIAVYDMIDELSSRSDIEKFITKRISDYGKLAIPTMLQLRNKSDHISFNEFAKGYAAIERRVQELGI